MKLQNIDNRIDVLWNLVNNFLVSAELIQLLPPAPIESFIFLEPEKRRFVLSLLLVSLQAKQ